MPGHHSIWRLGVAVGRFTVQKQSLFLTGEVRFRYHHAAVLNLTWNERTHRNFWVLSCTKADSNTKLNEFTMYINCLIETTMPQLLQRKKTRSEKSLIEVTTDKFNRSKASWTVRRLPRDRNLPQSLKIQVLLQSQKMKVYYNSLIQNSATVLKHGFLPQFPKDEVLLQSQKIGSC